MKKPLFEMRNGKVHLPRSPGLDAWLERHEMVVVTIMALLAALTVLFARMLAYE